MKKVFKVISSLALAVVLIAGAGADAMAATSQVTYEGNAQEFIFEPGSDYSPTDLFTDFKGVMPGDQLNQNINIKNNGAADVDVEIFVKAEGAIEDEEFLNQMNLTVTDKENSELFNAPADKTAGLTDWVSLGTFEKGADTDLNVALDVPITMGNDFQDRIGMLNWTFKVAEYPIAVEPGEKPDTIIKPNGDADASIDSNGPQTGDYVQLGLYAVICVGALVLIICLVRRKHSRR